jgi:hypothetical protein
MTVPSHAVQMAMLRAVAENLDDGTGNAAIVYYSGSRPLSEATTADPLARLVTLNLQKPSVKTLGEDSIELHSSETGVAVKAGTATWARLYNAAGQAVIDMDIGSEIILDDPNIVLGSTVKLDAIFLEPE